MRAAQSLLHTLCSLCTKNLTREQVNYLIESAQKLSSVYIKYHLKNLSGRTLSRDITIREMSIDSITPLFERDDSGCFVKIKTAFEKWQPPIETEQAALFFLNRLVIKNVERYISGLLRESDPFFSAILDSVDYIITKLNYQKKRFLGSIYIIEDHKEILPSLLPDKLYLDRLPLNIFRDINRMLPDIFDDLRTRNNLTPAVPLNALIIKIKEARSPVISVSCDQETPGTLDITYIISNAIEAVRAKLKESYLNKEKLNAREADAFIRTLDDIALDLKAGGINPGLHLYLIDRMPGLSFEDYRVKYQHILEYLYKYLKDVIKNNLGTLRV